MKTKEEFHKLIDQIHDEQALNAYYELIQRLNASETGGLWNSLTDGQKGELVISYNESFDSDNLIAHQEVKKQHEKWLRK